MVSPIISWAVFNKITYGKVVNIFQSIGKILRYMYPQSILGPNFLTLNILVELNTLTFIRNI